MFAESKEEAEKNAKHIITATTSKGTGVNEDKNEVRVWGRSSKEDTVRIGQVDCGALKEKVKHLGIWMANNLGNTAMLRVECRRPTQL